MRNSLKLFCLFSFILLLLSCNTNSEKENIISVTIVPQKFFAEKIAGDKFKINTMVPAGSSPETYEPSASSMVSLDKSKGYFRIGNIGFEINWIEKLRQNHPELKIFDNSKNIGIIEDEEIFDMTEDTDHSHGEDCNGHHSCHHDGDPHIWSSPSNALKIAQNMYESFLTIDPDNSEYYTTNYELLKDEITGTKDSISSILANSKGATFVIYHPSLTYFAQEFGLKQFAIEDNGKEPSAATLKKLIDEVRKTNAKVVFIQQEFDKKNAQIIADELNLKVVQINPLSDDWANELIKVAHAIAENNNQ